MLLRGGQPYGGRMAASWWPAGTCQPDQTWENADHWIFPYVRIRKLANVGSAYSPNGGVLLSSPKSRESRSFAPNKLMQISGTHLRLHLHSYVSSPRGMVVFVFRKASSSLSGAFPTWKGLVCRLSWYLRSGSWPSCQVLCLISALRSRVHGLGNKSGCSSVPPHCICHWNNARRNGPAGRSVSFRSH